MLHQSFKLNPSTFSPLHLLRYYLNRAPATRSTLCKTAGLTGAGYTFVVLSTPIRVDSKNNSTMATTEGGDEVRGRTQQSPIASQRAREQGQSQQGRFGQWFPLGAKEDFSQWVRDGIVLLVEAQS